MAQHQDQFCVQVFHCILDAAQNVIRGDITGNPNNKQVAQALIEYKFGRHARIGTAQNHCEWMLSRFQLFTTGKALVGVLLLVPGISAVAFSKPGKSLICGDNGRRFLPQSVIPLQPNRTSQQSRERTRGTASKM
jgi:hypothetical protein